MWTDYLYLTEARARHYGFTHHGRLFGVPAWIREDGDPDTMVACPKVALLQFYCMAMDAVFETLSYFLPEDVELVTPYTLGAKLIDDETFEG